MLFVKYKILTELVLNYEMLQYEKEKIYPGKSNHPLIRAYLVFSEDKRLNSLKISLDRSVKYRALEDSLSVSSAQKGYIIMGFF